MKTIESESRTPMCFSHKCNVCGKKLRVGMGKGEKIFLIGLVLFYLVLIGGLTLLQRATTTGCYTREYIDGRGTNFETLRNTDIKCPI